MKLRNFLHVSFLLSQPLFAVSYPDGSVITSEGK